MRDDLAHVIGDPCFGLDAGYRITFWNPAMQALTGAPAAAVCGRGIFEVIPAARGTAVHDACEAALRTGVPASVSYTSAALVPGRRFSFGMYPHRDGLIVLARDFTEQYQLERRLREREAELEAAIDERDFLLRELQHRVANGVQALLAMSRLGSTPGDDAAIERLGQRVRGTIRIRRLLAAHEVARGPEPARAYLSALITETLDAELPLEARPEVVVDADVGPFAGAVGGRLGVVIIEVLVVVATRPSVTRLAIQARREEHGLHVVIQDDAQDAVPEDAFAALRDLIASLGATLAQEPRDGAWVHRVELAE